MTRSSSSLLIGLMALTAAGAAFAQESAPPAEESAAATFDPSPTILDAAAVVPAELLRGDHHEVMQRVENDGLMNRYQIASDFGRFEAYGTLVLAVRVQEVGALAELDRLSKTEVFAEAAARSALSSVDTIQTFAEQPVETVRAVPSGAKRMLKVARRRAKEARQDATEEIKERRDQSAEGDGESEGEGEGMSATELAADAAEAGNYLIKRYFGVTAAERRWAAKLGVDPYTSNEVLRKEIKKVARVDSAGRLGVKLLPIPGIPGVSAIAMVNKVAWNKDPYELQDFNRERLRSLGMDEELIEAFFEVPWLSPTMQTFFITSLLRLEGAQDRSIAVEQVLGLESLDEGSFLAQAAQMLGWLHVREAPIRQLLRGERTLVAVTADRKQLIPMPVDHLSWTSDLAELVERRNLELGRPEYDGGTLWLLRTASDLSREGLAALGWSVETDLGGRMRAEPLVDVSADLPAAERIHVAEQQGSGSMRPRTPSKVR